MNLVLWEWRKPSIFEWESEEVEKALYRIDLEWEVDKETIQLL